MKRICWCCTTGQLSLTLAITGAVALTLGLIINPLMDKVINEQVYEVRLRGTTSAYSARG